MCPRLGEAYRSCPKGDVNQHQHHAPARKRPVDPAAERVPRPGCTLVCKQGCKRREGHAPGRPGRARTARAGRRAHARARPATRRCPRRWRRSRSRRSACCPRCRWTHWPRPPRTASAGGRRRRPRPGRRPPPSLRRGLRGQAPRGQLRRGWSALRRRLRRRRRPARRRRRRPAALAQAPPRRGRQLRGRRRRSRPPARAGAAQRRSAAVLLRTEPRATPLHSRSACTPRAGARISFCDRSAADPNAETAHMRVRCTAAGSHAQPGLRRLNIRNSG